MAKTQCVPIRAGKFEETIMKTNLMRVALACAALALTSATAIANVIPGVDVIVKRHPPKDLAIPPVTTDAKGQATFKLAPGEYEIDIDGKTLAAALAGTTDKFQQRDKTSSSPSVGLSVGGLFGGSSHSSHKGSGHEGLDNGHPDSGRDTSHSSGGVGFGLGIPVGGGDKGAHPPGNPITAINISLPDAPNIEIEAPYCPDSASQGAHIQFTVPDGGGTVTLQMSIADQASAGNLTSY
jgi:hypothetical protein